jgi:hypothetical protein
VSLMPRPVFHPREEEAPAIPADVSSWAHKESEEEKIQMAPPYQPQSLLKSSTCGSRELDEAPREVGEFEVAPRALHASPRHGHHQRPWVSSPDMTE